MMEPIVVAVVLAMNCDAAQKYYYILIVVAVDVISWLDENNFHNIIGNNLSALFHLLPSSIASEPILQIDQRFFSYFSSRSRTLITSEISSDLPMSCYWHGVNEWKLLCFTMKSCKWCSCCCCCVVLIGIIIILEKSEILTNKKA